MGAAVSNQRPFACEAMGRSARRSRCRVPAAVLHVVFGSRQPRGTVGEVPSAVAPRARARPTQKLYSAFVARGARAGLRGRRKRERLTVPTLFLTGRPTAWHVLHFRNFSHSQRVKAAQDLAQFSIAKVTNVIIAKRELIAQADPIYLWACGCSSSGCPGTSVTTVTARQSSPSPTSSASRPANCTTTGKPCGAPTPTSTGQLSRPSVPNRATEEDRTAAAC